MENRRKKSCLWQNKQDLIKRNKINNPLWKLENRIKQSLIQKQLVKNRERDEYGKFL